MHLRKLSGSSFPSHASKLRQRRLTACPASPSLIRTRPLHPIERNRPHASRPLTIGEAVDCCGATQPISFLTSRRWIVAKCRTVIVKGCPGPLQTKAVALRSGSLSLLPCDSPIWFARSVGKVSIRRNGSQLVVRCDRRKALGVAADRPQRLAHLLTKHLGRLRLNDRFSAAPRQPSGARLRPLLNRRPQHSSGSGLGSLFVSRGPTRTRFA